MNERAQIADQLRQVIAIQSDSGILTPENYNALNDAIKELEKNCGNCKFSEKYYMPKTGEPRFDCKQSYSKMPEDFKADHFCGFHEPKTPWIPRTKNT